MLSEYTMIRDSILKKGYQWFDIGNYNLNIIWVRMSDHVSNMMDDKCYVCYKVDGTEYVHLFDANTKPALYGALYSPVTVRGITGTAVLQPQQVKGYFQFIDKGFNDSYNPWINSFFLQVKPAKIWRDNDRNDEITAEQPELSVPGDGICAHIQENPLSSPNSKPWSIGCLGLHKKDLIEIYPIVKKAIELWGSGFTLTIIENRDLLVPIE